MTEGIEALLEAHERVIVEREEAKQMMDDTEFRDGHINGLNEARNRVEECIMERCGDCEVEVSVDTAPLFSNTTRNKKPDL